MRWAIWKYWWNIAWKGNGIDFEKRCESGCPYKMPEAARKDRTYLEKYDRGWGSSRVRMGTSVVVGISKFKPYSTCIFGQRAVSALV